MQGHCAILSRRRWKELGLGLSLLFGLAACSQSDSDSSCNAAANGLKSTGWDGQDLNEKQLSFIFLKGPSAATAEIGTFMQFNSAPSAFFVQGSNVEDYTAQLVALRDQGHLIGNSGYRYADITQAAHPVLELRTTDALIRPYITGNMFLFYAPLKVFNEQTSALFRVNRLGKYIGPIKDDTTPSPTFRYDEQCWLDDLTPAACAAQYFDEITRLNRGIVAFTDTQTKTLEMLNQLLPQLTAFGFSFVRLDQIPGIRTALTRAGGQVDQAAGPAACDDYE